MIEEGLDGFEDEHGLINLQTAAPSFVRAAPQLVQTSY